MKFLALLTFALSPLVFAHPGRTDAYGCHNDYVGNLGYHCHGGYSYSSGGSSGHSGKHYRSKSKLVAVAPPKPKLVYSKLVGDVQSLLCDYYDLMCSEVDSEGDDYFPLDGLLGSDTKMYIRKFQKTHGLPVTGKVSDKLKRKLERVIAHRNSEALKREYNDAFEDSDVPVFTRELTALLSRYFIPRTSEFREFRLRWNMPDDDEVEVGRGGGYQFLTKRVLRENPENPYGEKGSRGYYALRDYNGILWGVFGRFPKPEEFSGLECIEIDESKSVNITGYFCFANYLPLIKVMEGYTLKGRALEHFSFTYEESELFYTKNPEFKNW